MKNLFIVAAILAGAIATNTANARDFTAGALTIATPTIFETAPTAMSGGGYMEITNTGDEADKLIEVRADFPQVMIHTTVEEDGVAKMMHIEGLDLPAGETVTLKPGGLHIMFMGLDGNPMEVGEEIPATLVFEKAGEVEVVFDVLSRSAPSNEDSNSGEHMDHSNH